MKIIACLIVFVSLVAVCRAQRVRLDNLKETYGGKAPLKISGGISANTVFRGGDDAASAPFTWVLSGNVNVGLFDMFNLPLGFNFNNLGGNYTYPTMPNRLSLHPVYKWATAHVGDVSMSFSPYTLNGHQFTGGGVELAPENFPLKVAAMYGRLLRATEYNPDERLNAPAYKRTGYGIKAEYSAEKYSAGMSLFLARDHENSLQNLPDSLGLAPQCNLASSWNVELKLVKNLTFSAEYGISLLTRDLRTGDSGSSFADMLSNRNPSAETFHAVRAEISLQLMKNNVGFGYERIDPGYRSLGAYYFTNDLENFTLNFSRPLFKDKLTFATNVGVQRDDLYGDKAESNLRLVGALNLNYNPGERLNVAFSYSNFQSYTNMRSQFDRINETTEYDNLDTLNFSQLSQNVVLNVGWNFGNAEVRKHTIGLNLNWQEAVDRRNGTVGTGDGSQMYNLACDYGLFFVPPNVQVTASANLTYNTVGYDNTLTCGPNLGVSSRLFDKSLTAGVSASYNLSVERGGNPQSGDGSRRGSVVNLRGNLAYTLLKKHNLNLVLVNRSASVANRPKRTNFTVTMSYAYGF